MDRDTVNDDRWLPQVDRLRCTGCGLCVSACPNGTLGLAAGAAVVARPAACRYTGTCELVCPDDAIHLFFVVRRAAADASFSPQGSAMTPYQFIPDLTEALLEIPPDSIVSRTLHGDEAIKAVLFGFAPGQELSEHTASQPATLLFLAGEATLTLGGETEQVGPGSWVHMPPNLPHTIKARSKLIMLLLLIRCARVKSAE